MKKIYIRISLTFLAAMFLFSGNVSAQVSSLYYMKTVSTRHELNPAFQPLSSVYVDLPIIPSFYLSAGNNSLTMSDVLYPRTVDGKKQLVTFLHPQGNKDDFYNTLRKTTRIYTEFDLTLLSFGFKVNNQKSFISVGVTERFIMGAFLPKDLFKLALYGTPDINGVNSYDFSKLSINATAYTEIAFGYSQQVNDRLTVGGKAKFLLGQANVSTKIDKFKMDASRDVWHIDAEATANMAIPYVDYKLDEEGKLDDFDFNEPDDYKEYKDLLLKPAGRGLAFDLGATYKLLDNRLMLSASVLDLGFINWKRNVANLPANGRYTFEGVEINIDDDDIGQSIEDNFKTIEDSLHYTTTFDKYRTGLSTKALIGAEYSILDEKITFGLLSKSTFLDKRIYQEFTTSVNFLPINWFNATLSYSWMNGRGSNFGVGLGGRMGPFNMFLAADYCPFNYTSDYIPHKTKTVNLQFGVVLAFGNNPNKRADDDRDGVKNSKDKCPDTPLGYQVNKKGCTVDEDGDGVADNVDKCPGTPAGVQVDEFGCPVDNDGDGVPDYLDKCPNTPQGVQVDENGCPLDSDGDGVSDDLDKCPNTPQGIPVDENGCPFDADGDGVPDYLDKCPGTPEAARGMVDENGCPKDSDGDGIPDYLDKCPGTPEAARGMIDKDGCPIDTDGDGVPDYLDKCPGTPAAAKGMVDENGCPKDTDGDGIPDYLDECPTIKGVKENKGCPEVKASVKKIFEKALQGIQFESGKDVIKSSSYPVLDQIVTVMKENTDHYLVINGHTDNVGNAASNMILSEKRAASVKNYLVSKGVEPERLSSYGYGDTKPMVPNTTAANKAKNRRVEFVVKFEREVEAE